MSTITNNKIYIGTVTSITDYDNTIIKFNIPNLVNEGLAYPLMSEKKPKVGDEIVLFQMSSQLNAFWYYLKIDQTGEFILEYNGANFIFKDGQLYVQANKINFGNKVSGTEAKNGTESYVYGTKLKSWLTKLVDVLEHQYKVITPQGPSATATPDSITQLEILRTNIDRLISDYMKAVDDKGNLTL